MATPSFEWVRSASLSDSESGLPLPSAEFVLLPADGWGQQGQEDEKYSQAGA